MNQRERLLAMAVLGVIVLAASAFLFHQLFYLPLQNRNAGIERLKDELAKKTDRVALITAEKPKLQRWRQLSLPTNVELARREYERYLSGLLRASGFASGTFTVTPRPIDTKSSPTITGKGPVYTKLSFIVHGRADLASLVTMLERFYRTSLLQQIRNVQIQRPLTTGAQESAGQLDVNLTIEALIVHGAENRPYLLPNLSPFTVMVEGMAGLVHGPAGIVLAAWSLGPSGPIGPGALAQPARNYAAIASKNIFLGPPPVIAEERPKNEVEVTRFVHLTDITLSAEKNEAFLYDRYNNKTTRLRCETAFDSFRVMDGEGETLVRGRVVRIEHRDLIFKVEDSYYSMHVGQALAEVMRRPLNDEELKALGLVQAGPAGAANGEGK